MTPDDLDRLRTIIDEAFGMQPPIADADLLTELERLLRDQGSALQSALLRIEQQEAVLSKPEDARLRDVIEALDGRSVMLESPGDRVRWILRELDEWITRAGAAERERYRLRKLFDDAGQGEHNVLALVDHYQREAMAADDRLRATEEVEKTGQPIWRTGTGELRKMVDAHEWGRCGNCDLKAKLEALLASAEVVALGDKGEKLGGLKDRRYAEVFDEPSEGEKAVAWGDKTGEKVGAPKLHRYFCAADGCWALVELDGEYCGANHKSEKVRSE